MVGSSGGEGVTKYKTFKEKYELIPEFPEHALYGRST